MNDEVSTVSVPETSTQETSSQSAPEVSTQTAISESSAATPSQTTSEAKYTREQLARAVKESTKNVYDKAYQDAVKQLQEKAVAQSSSQASVAPVADESKFRELVREENSRMQQENEVKLYYDNLSRDFLGKVQAAKQNDPEIETKFKELGMDFDNVTAADPRVMLFNSIDNIGDVVNELDKNPSKLANILTLLNVDMATKSKLSYKELKKLSDSIKFNKSAQELPKAPAPSRQIEPSNSGLSSGEASYSEERKKRQYQF